MFMYVIGCMGTAATSDTGSKTSTLPMILMMVGLVVVMYFVTIRPQKKRQQEEQKLRDSIQIGDNVTTIGGITGRIITVKEDSIVIETSADRTKLSFMRWAIQTNNTAEERAAEEKAAIEAEKAKEKEEKQQNKRRSKKSDIDEIKE